MEVFIINKEFTKLDIMISLLSKNFLEKNFEVKLNSQLLLNFTNMTVLEKLVDPFYNTLNTEDFLRFMNVVLLRVKSYKNITLESDDVINEDLNNQISSHLNILENYNFKRLLEYGLQEREIYPFVDSITETYANISSNFKVYDNLYSCLNNYIEIKNFISDFSTSNPNLVSFLNTFNGLSCFFEVKISFGDFDLSILFN